MLSGHPWEWVTDCLIQVRRPRKETNDLSSDELSTKRFIPLGIEEKKPQNCLLAGHTTMHLLHTTTISVKQSNRSIQAETIKITRWDLGIADRDRLIEVKFTVIKGRIFRAFFN